MIQKVHGGLEIFKKLYIGFILEKWMTLSNLVVFLLTRHEYVKNASSF